MKRDAIAAAVEYLARVPVGTTTSVPANPALEKFKQFATRDNPATAKLLQWAEEHGYEITNFDQNGLTHAELPDTFKIRRKP